MKKILFTAGTVAVLALASCSNDETSQEALVNPNEIRYEVVTNNSTRTNTLWSSQNSLKQNFYVFAQQASSTTEAAYINGDVAKYDNGAWSFPTHYWPDFSLDFYAASGTNGGTVSFDIAADKVKVSNVSMSSASDSQDDMVYAVTPNRAKADGAVPFNFRHALAQLVFKAKKNSDGINVHVAGIELVNIKTQGTVAYKTDATYKTDGAYQYIDDASTIADGSTTQTNVYQNNNTSIAWTLPADQTLGAARIGASTTATGSPVAAANILATDLTLTSDAQLICSKAGTDEKAASIFVIPQTISPLTFTINTADGADNSVPVANIKDMYFLITCAIQNIADGSGTPASTDQWVYGSGQYNAADDDAGTPAETVVTEYKQILIPVKTLYHYTNDDGEDAVAAEKLTSWEAGKKYIYTFIFGQDANGDPGNGGLDPENPDPTDPVLQGIKIDFEALTMDDHATVGTTYQYMTYPDNEEAPAADEGSQGGGTGE